MGTAKDTKSKIIDSFTKIYSKKSLENIFVNDICDDCSISRGTFYYHFTDVFALCDQLEDRVIEDMEADLDATIMSTYVNQLNNSNVDMFIEAYVKCLQSYKARIFLYRTLLNGSHGREFTKKWIISVRSKMDSSFRFINLDKSMQEWVGVFLAAGLVNMVSRWIDLGCEEDPKLIATAFSKAMFEGALLAPK